MHSFPPAVLNQPFDPVLFLAFKPKWLSLAELIEKGKFGGRGDPLSFSFGLNYYSSNYIIRRLPDFVC